MRAAKASSKEIEQQVEALGDAALSLLYPPTTPILCAREITRWLWIGGRRVPRNTGEDFWGCLDRLVLRPDGRMHGIQLTTLGQVSARRAKVTAQLVEPWTRATMDAGEAVTAPPLIDVWAPADPSSPSIPRLRAWRLRIAPGASEPLWAEVALEIDPTRLLGALLRGEQARATSRAVRSPRPRRRRVRGATRC